MALLFTSEATPSFSLLPALVLLPFLGAAVIALIPRSRPDTHRAVAIMASLLTGALALWTLVDFTPADGGFQMVSRRDWVADLGLSWHFGIDGISLFLVVLTGVLFPLAVIACRPEHNPKAYYAWLLVLMAGSMGAFTALDLLLFFVFFEVVLVPMYFLIGQWGHGNRQYAANKFFLFTMAGSALMLVGLVALVVLNQRATGRVTFDLVTLAESQAISKTAGRWIFAAFALAFAVKVPLFPVHTWLPDAHTEAPTAGSVILAGVMLKLGTYGLLRFGVYLFPEAAVYFGPVLLTLGVVGIIYGAIVATMQKDLKRLVAYSSVAHLGFIVLGLFALNTQGIEGGVLQMINHGISTPALFLLVGMIYERRHTRQIAELSGLQTVAPVMAGVFTFVMLSSIGLPGLNGFVGEFLALLGGFHAHRWWGVVAAAGVILAALYLLWAYQRVFHGPVTDANRGFAELRLSEGLVLAPLCALILFAGVYPKPMLDRIEPAVERLIEHVDANVDSFHAPEDPVPSKGAAEGAESGSHAQVGTAVGVRAGAEGGQ